MRDISFLTSNVVVLFSYVTTSFITCQINCNNLKVTRYFQKYLVTESRITATGYLPTFYFYREKSNKTVS